ncbi:sunset domain-containing protein [Paucilactobacillus wasatchensis]
MQAQSIGSNIIHFNVYIFNIENGVKINYTDGTSQVSSAQQATSTGQQTNSKTKSGSTGQQGDINTNDTGKIVGNINSHIYHVPGQSGYSMNSANAVYFNTEQEAQAAGYRKSLR